MKLVDCRVVDFRVYKSFKSAKNFMNARNDKNGENARVSNVFRAHCLCRVDGFKCVHVDQISEQ